MIKVKDVHIRNNHLIAITEKGEIPFIRINNGRIERINRYTVLHVPIKLHEKITRFIEKLK